MEFLDSVPMVSTETAGVADRSEVLLDGQAAIHRLLARRAPLPATLTVLTEVVEALIPGSTCSVLLLDDEGRFQTGAAPGLPDEYSAAINGLSPGPKAGSCGTAAFTGRTVVVTDIRTDPLWDDYRDLALPHGLAACWSTPIRSVEGGDVMGTFALYYREQRAPADADLGLVERLVDLAMTIIESGRVEDEARARTRELEQILSLTRAINAGRTVEEVLDGIFESFRGVIPYDRVEYATIEEQGDVLRTRWARAAYEHMQLTAGFVYRRAAAFAASDPSPRPTIDNDLVAYAAPRPDGNPTKVLVREGLRSALSCPLAHQGTVVGYLFFASKTPAAYRPSHALLVEQVAAQIAGAIEHRRLGDELLVRNEELEHLQQARSAFLATVSHELRTPLTAVVGLAAELRDHIDDLSLSEVSEFTGVIAREATDVAGIVEDLLVVARAEADEVSVAPQSVALDAKVYSVLAAWGKQTVDAIPITGGAVAWADSLRVRQIVRNLVSNARRHGGSNVEVRLSTLGSTARLQLVDDGDPIPEDLQLSMFEPFAHGTADRARPGSVGLGLWVARHLARAMDGDLVYRADGVNIFELQLPTSAGPRS